MSQKTKRRLATVMAAILVISLMASLLLSLVGSTLARSSKDIAGEMNELDNQADDYAQQADDLRSQAEEKQQQALEAVQKKLNIDQAIVLLEDEIDQTKAELQNLNLEIAAKQAEVDEAVAAEAAKTEQYKTRLRAMEENGEESYWSVIFRASSLSDLLDQLAMIADISKADQLMQEQLAEARARVEREQDALETKRVERSAKQAELEEKQTLLSEKRAEVDELILALCADNELLLAAEDEASKMEAELRAQSLALLSDYNKAVQRENAASSAPSSGTASASGFLFPLPSGTAYVSCPYGYRYHPIRGDYTFHYGVDLAAASGTSIYAAKSGTVVQSTMASVNGNYVTIQHSDGTSTLYAHMSSRAVSVGDYVSQGSVIGYVGTTGLSTGPHLHFEIYVNGSTVNPMEYVSVS